MDENNSDGLNFCYVAVDDAVKHCPGVWTKTTLRRLFREHLVKVSAALYVIDVAESGTYVGEAEDNAILDVLGNAFPKLQTPAATSPEDLFEEHIA